MRTLISGATGFIASHTVEKLLAEGHEVVGTVRDPSDAEKTEFLRKLPGAAERLTLVAANLNDPRAFADYTGDADYVIHAASPYVLTVKDAQRDLVDPAVNGTLSMLRACATSKRIKRVVVTSSVAAITDEPDTSQILDEADWNDRSTLSRNPYYYSKVCAERAAWKFAEDANPGWDLVVINPFTVIGPSKSVSLNTSNQVIADLLNGKYPAIMDLTLGLVDVRDVAEAHVQALASDRAKGRYICAHDLRTVRQIAGLLKSSGFDNARLPSLGLDTRLGSALIHLAAWLQPSGVRTYLHSHLGRVPRFDNSKIREHLGVTFRDLDRSIVETAEDLVRWGHVPER